ncbi:hypothetical protein [Methylotenera sp.]|uniref:hypothetical protein n=1 Tax=Methylotenera sp. TaxID=2051956 RepID=UPI00248A3CBC|nr:hypothetical protein [Methylotenera sp.]MDI1298611.1 hypothetical protein [Methylotenera sp.]
MARDYLLVDGVDSDTKEALKQEAMRRFGKANASLLVRRLIADCLDKNLFSVENNSVENNNDSNGLNVEGLDLKGKHIRIGLSLPEDCLSEIDRRATMRLSPRNYYICNLIFKDLGRPQLLIDEVNVLVSSNYEMARISNALKSISSSYSLSVKNGVVDNIPEFSKSLNKVKLDVDKHIALIVKTLGLGTIYIESKGKGKGTRK